jgi:hypothetical protein
VAIAGDEGDRRLAGAGQIEDGQPRAFH